MKYDDLKNVIREVLKEENAWEKFLRKEKERVEKSKPYLPRLVPQSAPKAKEMPREEGDVSIPFKSEEPALKTDEEAFDYIRNNFDPQAPARRTLGKDEQGYFVRQTFDTKGT
jgi:hypothetical protein